MSYGMAGDAKSCSTLAAVLEGLPEKEVLAAQAKAPGMFAEYLADKSPKLVKDRHPFAFFVGVFGGLRVEAASGSSWRPSDLPEVYR